MSNNLFIACNLAALAIGLLQLSRSGKLEWKSFAAMVIAAQVVLFGIAVYFATPNENSASLAAALEQKLQGVTLWKLTLWAIWEHVVRTTVVPVAALHLLSKVKAFRSTAVEWVPELLSSPKPATRGLFNFFYSNISLRLRAPSLRDFSVPSALSCTVVCWETTRYCFLRSPYWS